MPDETQGALSVLRASMPYLEACNLEQFRRELIVQAFDGASVDEIQAALEAARLELEHDVIRP
jgi:ribosome recycling factor